VRAFSHYKAAKMFEDGCKLLKTDPIRAEELLRVVVQIESDNPWGWIYLLFAMEDNGRPFSMLITTCSKLVEVSTKKPLHGIDGLAVGMIDGYLKRAEEMGLKVL